MLGSVNHALIAAAGILSKTAISFLAGHGVPALSEAVFVVTFYSRFVFWPYLAGCVILLLGVLRVRKDLSSAHGLDKVVLFGPLFYALPIAAFGAEHLDAAKFIMQAVPPWMPARLFWAYFVGVCLVAAALSIILQRNIWISATLLGIMFCLFVAMLHIPGVVHTPRNRNSWAIVFRDSSFAAGALALAATQTQEWLVRGRHKLISFSRVVIAIAAIFFAVEVFLHPRNAPGIPLPLEIPAWVPVRIFWAYLSSVITIVSALCLLVQRKERLAAAALGIVLFLLVVFVYLPLLIAKPSDIAVAFNYVADTLMYSGTVLLLAGALPHEAVAAGSVERDRQNSPRDTAIAS